MTQLLATLLDKDGRRLTLRVEVCQYMTGGKVAAARMNDKLFVTPAVYSLMQGATPEEMEHLCKHLRVVNLGEFDTFSLLPMSMRLPQ